MLETTALKHLGRGQWITLIVSITLLAAAGLGKVAGVGPVAEFVIAGLALAALAALVGQAIDQVGDRLGPSATGLLQSTLGNLPELFVCLFALSDGLDNVVRAALVGSILGNAVLVLGCAFVFGGLRHGTQRFDPEEPRLNASLLMLAVAALLVPTLASELETPAAQHTAALSNICALVLLAVYAATVPFYLRDRNRPVPNAYAPAEPHAGAPAEPHPDAPAEPHPDDPAEPDADDPAELGGREPWPLALSAGLLALGSLGAALAADWFVEPLQEATKSLGMSDVFVGLVVVAIASNAVEHVVGIRFALKAKPEYAISTTLNSPLQVALLLTPVLILLSPAVGPVRLTLVFPPLMVAALAVSTLVVTVIIYDGEYTWVEGVALIGLYFIVAASFWWG